MRQQGGDILVNTNKLRGKIVECEMSVSDLAEAIGIDKATLYRKLNNSESFTIGDADSIASALNLSKEDAVAIFFGQYVA